MTENAYHTPQSDLLNSEQHASQQKVTVFNPKGRIGRLRYVAYATTLAMLSYLIPMAAAFIMLFFFPEIPALRVIGVILTLVGGFYAIRIVVYATIQRCHDFGMSGWLSLCLLVPLSIIIFSLIPGDDEANRFGPPAVPNSMLTKVAAGLGVVMALWYLLGVLYGVSVGN